MSRNVSKERVPELFAEALERPAAERDAWLAEACDGDEALRAEVERLLRAHEAAQGFIETPALAALGDEPTRELTGERIGPYRALRLLGRGGMGVVYLAERADGMFEKEVAIKLLSADAGDEERERFRRERQILADLEHPNIARLLDAGTVHGKPYFVMEYVPGESLREALRLRGRLSAQEVQPIVAQICEGLAEAHDREIIHRDIKPENLILCDRGGRMQVKILDFGIARQQTSATMRTHPSAILGTVSYMSPEQAAGNAPIDARSDLYSLGMVIYEMLTGAPAFQSDSYLQVLYRHQHEAPRPPHEACPEAEIPPAVSAVVLRTLAKSPDERPQTARELADDFARALTARHRPSPPRRWRRAIAPLLAALVVLLAGWGLWSLGSMLRRPVGPEGMLFRVFKKDASERISLIEGPLPEEMVLPEERIQFEVTLPFAGYCYLFYEGRDGKLVWLNPQRDRPPQHARAGEPLRVPEKDWLKFGKESPRNQVFQLVYVPDGVPWALADALPVEEQQRLLRDDPEKHNFPYTPIPEPFAEKLRKALEARVQWVSFPDLPEHGRHLRTLAPAEARGVLAHKVTIWHQVN